MLEAEIEAILADKTTAEWIKIIGEAGVPCGPINNIAQALRHPQVEARNMLITAPDGSGGTLKLSGNPAEDDSLPRSADARCRARARWRSRRDPEKSWGSDSHTAGSGFAAARSS